MKKLQEVPIELIDSIQSEHELAMQTILEGYDRLATLPARVVKMQIDRPSKQEQTLEDVIVPEIWVYLSSKGLVKKDTIDRSSIQYILGYTNKPFPYGHIYQSSGHLCLGNIFVPQLLSIHHPQLPLETLFLHNDHNTGHGGASITVNASQFNQVTQYLHMRKIKLTDDIFETFDAGKNLIANDAIWIISAEVLAQSRSQKEAISIMAAIFSIIFNKQKGD